MQFSFSECDLVAVCNMHVLYTYLESQEEEMMKLSERIKDRFIAMLEAGWLANPWERFPQLLKAGKTGLEDLKELLQLETINAELLEALKMAKGPVEFLACATDSDPEDHELLEVVNKAIAYATEDKHA